jgi:phospholipid/cholesterol/gamma-HCH transport system substrate-binding protein
VYLYIPDATGLAPDSPVRVDGIPVGKVASVDLSGSAKPERVIRVTMRVEREQLASIPTDSFAELSSEDLAGDKFVDITSGIGPQLVEPGGEVPFKSPGGFMKSLDLSQFEAQLRLVDTTLTEIEQGKSRLGKFILGDQFYQDLRKRTTEIQSAMRTIASTTSDVGQALYSDRLFKQISEPLVALDQDLASLQSGQGPVGQLLRDSGQYDQLQAGTQNLRKTISDLRAGDWLKSDQMYQDWNRGLASLIQSVEEMNANPLLTRSDTYESLNGFAKEFGSTVRDFRQNPKKYLWIKLF